MLRVTTTACANIALCKYWGKAADGNSPATPSISLSLNELKTTTTVSRIDAGQDQIELQGSSTPQAIQRIAKFLDLWRSLDVLEGRFRVETANSFPAASGLASSASGFAALTFALAQMANCRLTTIQQSWLARHGSGSAARSITGGLSYMPDGPDAAAELLAPATDVPWAMAVAVVAEGPKAVSSREGMQHCRKTSPYYKTWLATARRDCSSMLNTLDGWNLPATGELMEANTLAMHSCMLAARPRLGYWTAETLNIFGKVADWRGQGLEAYATTDAGANVAVLCRTGDLESTGRRLKRLPGVLKVIASRAGDGPKVVDSK